MTLRDTTYAFGGNVTYIADLYEQYLKDPSSVGQEWQTWFANFGHEMFDAPRYENGNKVSRSKVVGISEIATERRSAKPGRRKIDGKATSSANDAQSESIRAHMLIRAYRVRGHLLATLDPLGLEVTKWHPELDPKRYGFEEKDYDHPIIVGGWLGKEKASLREILAILKETYCSNFALEYVHIQSLEKREWLEKKIESTRAKPSFSGEEKLRILKNLTEVVGFEEFLHIKYPGAKRFSVEGGEGLLPALEKILETSAKLGVNEVVLGMPHRGRLNVLTAFMKKPYASMLSEFEGNLATPKNITSSGDVKYHLGISSDREFPGIGKVHLSLTANPSHLEAVNPVVVGKVRAKQDQKGDNGRSQVMGLLIHGDAAFCGQGIVAETFSLSQLEGYKTGGTVHVIVNNQVGFTARPHEGHVTPYPTDIAKAFEAPIFHVNGDDPEVVLHACQIAAEYRQEFKTDVVVDIFCYRKYGHNEGDEPFFTQPVMYRKIAEKPTPRDVYAERLVGEKLLSAEEYKAMKTRFHEFLEAEHAASKTYKPNKADWLEGKWLGLEKPSSDAPELDTGVSIKALKEVGKKISEVPAGVTPHNKIVRMLETRAKMFESGEGFDWAAGELLAFGTLLVEGHPVRLSGQDSARGTFSHRHSALIDQQSEKPYFPLKHLADKQGSFEVINSNLSEFGVLGYEYGYASTEPNALVIWEAQFGDFVNGAQIIIDQFISSAEVKWLRMNGLVMLLPHGYEGQGPEHSSARLERFLQQCAEDNMQVVNCTTPANYFHLLRRQLKRKFRKPLIVMSPKSLLRHPRAKSTLAEMGPKTSFRRVIADDRQLSNKKLRRVIFCSGKIYYELLEAMEAKKIDDIALVRVEQLYPFPLADISAALAKAKQAEVVWCQEEPENMGAWTYIDRRLEKAIVDSGSKAARPRYVGRPEAAATAAGYMKLHKAEQEKVIETALR